jgi:hypothetical protein
VTVSAASSGSTTQKIALALTIGHQVARLR